MSALHPEEGIRARDPARQDSGTRGLLARPSSGARYTLRGTDVFIIEERGSSVVNLASIQIALAAHARVRPPAAQAAAQLSHSAPKRAQQARVLYALIAFFNRTFTLDPIGFV